MWTEGEQYSGREISSILREAGFNNIQVKPTFGYWSAAGECANTLSSNSLMSRRLSHDSKTTINGDDRAGHV
jgi:hypothetical protein